MKTHEFTIQGVTTAGVKTALRLGIVRITLDTDAEDLIEHAMTDVYADRGSAPTADLMLQLALQGLAVEILHKRQLA